MFSTFTCILSNITVVFSDFTFVFSDLAIIFFDVTFLHFVSKLIWQIDTPDRFKTQPTPPEISQGPQVGKQVQRTKKAAQYFCLHHEAHPNRYVLDLSSQRLYDMQKG
jgi:hypothetical protein